MKTLETDRPVTVSRPAVRPAPGIREERPIAASPCVGIVTGQDDEQFTIASGTLTAQGRRAVSCLLEPAVGDTVACLSVAPDQFWITAVLQREDGVAHRLRLTGPTCIDTGGAALSTTSGSLKLETDDFVLTSRRAEVHSEEALLIGQELKVIGRTVKLVGAALSSVFDRVVHYSKSHWRRTEGLDRVSAAHVEVEAQQILRQKGEHIFVNGEKLVKTISSQIQLG
jgi:hypothetical protein